jgi:hypothetical protein
MPKIRDYKDFTLELDNYNESTGEYQVRMPPSDEWGAPAPVTVKLDFADIETALMDLQAKEIYVEDLIPLGKKLAGRLMPEGTIRNNFVRAVKDASLEQGLRLRLLIRHVKLAQIPWEYTYLPLREDVKEDSTDRTHFLVVNPKVSLVRIAPMEGKVQELAMTDSEKLVLAGAMANPKATGFSELNLKAERRFIEKALQDFKVDGVMIEWEPFQEDVTKEDLDAALLKKPDIFHFSGHGMFSGREDQGSILLVEDKTSLKPLYLGAQSFAQKVASAGVRMVYLGACESSKLQDASAWTGVAQALIAQGVLAVLAMQYEVQDSKAITFAKSFYMALAAGLTVDEAVTAGRLAILDESDDKGIEWGVPTLYLRAKDGVLFKQLTEKDSKTAEGIRVAVSQVIDTVEKGGQVIGMRFKKDPKSGEYTAESRVTTVRGTVIGIEFDEL